MNFDILRPSTLARVAEDTIIRGFGNIADGARFAKRAIATEYQARSVVRLQSDVERQAARVARMTPAERKAFAADQAIVGQRIAALMDSQDARAARRAEREAAKRLKRAAKR